MELFCETIIYLVAVFGIIITIGTIFRVLKFKMFKLNKKCIDIYINNFDEEEVKKIEKELENIKTYGEVNIFKNI